MSGFCNKCGVDTTVEGEGVCLCVKCATKRNDSQTTGVQQLKAEIAALIRSLDRYTDDRLLTNGCVKKLLRQLSAA